MAASGSMIRCDACGQRSNAVRWADFWCPKCNEFNERLYRQEHVNRLRGTFMTRAEIEAEFAEAGRAFAPLPTMTIREMLGAFASGD